MLRVRIARHHPDVSPSFLGLAALPRPGRAPRPHPSRRHDDERIQREAQRAERVLLAVSEGLAQLALIAVEMTGRRLSFQKVLVAFAW